MKYSGEVRLGYQLSGRLHGRTKGRPVQGLCWAVSWGILLGSISLPSSAPLYFLGWDPLLRTSGPLCSVQTCLLISPATICCLWRRWSTGCPEHGNLSHSITVINAEICTTSRHGFFCLYLVIIWKLVGFAFLAFIAVQSMLPSVSSSS